MKKRLIVAITGATGSIYGMRILQQLRAIGGWESHLIVSDAGVLNAWQEYGLARKDLNKLADVVHNPRDVGAAVASGSFITQGMVIAPCSMKTLSGVAHAFSDNLITRAADVALKEGRPLVLVPRETKPGEERVALLKGILTSDASVARPEPSIWTESCTGSCPRPLRLKPPTTRSGSLRARPAQGFSWTVVNGITFDVARFDQRMTWS